MTGGQKKGLEILLQGLVACLKIAERLHGSATNDFDLADRMALIVADLSANQKSVVEILTDKNR